MKWLISGMLILGSIISYYLLNLDRALSKDSQFVLVKVSLEAFYTQQKEEMDKTGVFDTNLSSVLSKLPSARRFDSVRFLNPSLVDSKGYCKDCYLKTNSYKILAVSTVKNSLVAFTIDHKHRLVEHRIQKK